MKDRIKAEDVTKEELLKFDEELLSWYRDFASSLSGKAQMRVQYGSRWGSPASA